MRPDEADLLKYQVGNRRVGCLEKADRLLPKFIATGKSRNLGPDRHYQAEVHPGRRQQQTGGKTANTNLELQLRGARAGMISVCFLIDGLYPTAVRRTQQWQKL